MTNFAEEQRIQNIETAFAEHPWLTKYLQRDLVHEIKTEDNPRPNFLKTHVDNNFLHMEVMWMFGQNGEHLGEVGDLEHPNEDVYGALARLSVPVYFILKIRNFTHCVLYKAPEGKCLIEHIL